MNYSKFASGLFILFYLAFSGLAAPVIDPIADVTIPAGRSLILPITASSANGQPLTFTVRSSTPGIVATVHTNDPFWQLTVAQAASTNDPGAYSTPYRGGLVTVTNVGSMTFMLFPEYAPHTVNVFQGLTYSGFYNSNTIFHRVISNFVIQGGDPQTNGTGGLVFQYDDEFNPSAMFSGNGQLALANSGPNTDGSQFFVTSGAQRYEDYKYTLFGQMVRGFDVLTNIINTPVDGNDRPLADEIIQQAAFVNDSTDSVVTLAATNLPGGSGVITVIANDGIGGFATNTFNVSLVTDTNDNGQPFFYPGAVTNLVGPVRTTMTNVINAGEMGGDALYWSPSYLQTSYYYETFNSSYSLTNSTLKVLPYNITNSQGQYILYLVPDYYFAGSVSLQFVASSSSNFGSNYTEETYTFTFGDTPISGVPKTITALAGLTFTNLVLTTFTNGVTNTNSLATNFVAAINWGDDSTDNGTITTNGAGLKAVLGTHEYSYPGSYPVYVQITDAMGLSATILSYINVTNQITPAIGLLTASVTGQGSVSPSYSSTALNLGSNYSILATPASHWALLNWTDQNGFILGDGTNLNFTMTPGLSLTANFVPAVTPTLTIQYPVSSRTLTNIYSGTVSISGVASNNSPFSVWYQVNAGGWLQATGTANWTASFSPEFGLTNVIQAYAVNAVGYYSKTNVALVKYLAGDFLTVSTNGSGGTQPSLNGQLLPLGSNYMLTASPTGGFAFTNWTAGPGGSVLTNAAALKFTMTSNLVLTANFLDVTRPTLAITNPAASLASVSNVSYTIAGRSSDNVAVSNVLYSLNNAAYVSANVFNSGNGWNATVTLNTGSNLFSAYAVDYSGNNSLISTSRLNYIPSALLALNLTGRGTISPNYSNAVLALTQSYTMKATAVSGFSFTNWTAGVGGNVLTNGATVTFIMTTNSVFTANFLDVAAPTVSITNPAVSLLLVSNASYTLAGKSGDNVAVSNVLYSLNSAAYVPATLSNNGSNWAVGLTLNPSTNIVSVYAIDTSGNRSATSTVRLVYQVQPFAPASLSGYSAYVTPQGSSSSSLVAFGASTFSQYSADTNDNNGVGSYTYSRQTTNTGTLTIMYAAPPSATNAGSQTIHLTFLNYQDALFTNAPDSGTIQFQPVSSAAMASVSGQNLYFVQDSGKCNLIHFTSGSSVAVSMLGLTNGASAYSYTYAVYGVAGALLKATSTNGTTYIVTTTVGTNYGNVYLESRDPSGNFSSSDLGVFGFASQKSGGNAPAAITNLNSDIYSSGDLSTVSFGTNGFSQFDITDTNNFGGNGVGAYTYQRVSLSNALITLSYSNPPPTLTNGNTGGDALFIAPNLAIITNSPGSLTNNARFSLLALTAATNWAPASIAGQTGTAVSDVENSTNTVTYNNDGSFTQTIIGSGSESGTYVYNAYSPVGAMAVLTFTNGVANGSVVYVQLNFGEPGAGTYFSTTTSGYDWGTFSQQ